MLQDVRETGVVGGRGTEGDGEEVLRVVGEDVEDLCAALLMEGLDGGGADVGDGVDGGDAEAVEAFADGGESGLIGHGCPFVCGDKVVDSVDLVAVKPAAVLQDSGFQPEFGDAVIPFHMSMAGFVPVTGVEWETVRAM